MVTVINHKDVTKQYCIAIAVEVYIRMATVHDDNILSRHRVSYQTHSGKVIIKMPKVS